MRISLITVWRSAVYDTHGFLPKAPPFCYAEDHWKIKPGCDENHWIQWWRLLTMMKTTVFIYEDNLLLAISHTGTYEKRFMTTYSFIFITCLHVSRDCCEKHGYYHICIVSAVIIDYEWTYSSKITSHLCDACALITKITFLILYMWKG